MVTRHKENVSISPARVVSNGHHDQATSLNWDLLCALTLPMNIEMSDPQDTGSSGDSPAGPAFGDKVLNMLLVRTADRPVFGPF